MTTTRTYRKLIELHVEGVMPSYHQVQYKSLADKPSFAATLESATRLQNPTTEKPRWPRNKNRSSRVHLSPIGRCVSIVQLHTICRAPCRMCFPVHQNKEPTPLIGITTRGRICQSPHTHPAVILPRLVSDTYRLHG